MLWQFFSKNLLFFHELLPLSISIILIGFINFLESTNFLSLLINTEITLLGLNFYLLTLSILKGDYWAQIYVLNFIAINAAEVAIGLGLLILLYRTKRGINFDEYSSLKG